MSGVTFSKSLGLPKPHCPHLKNGDGVRAGQMRKYCGQALGTGKPVQQPRSTREYLSDLGAVGFLAKDIPSPTIRARPCSSDIWMRGCGKPTGTEVGAGGSPGLLFAPELNEDG